MVLLQLGWALHAACLACYHYDDLLPYFAIVLEENQWQMYCSLSSRRFN